MIAKPLTLDHLRIVQLLIRELLFFNFSNACKFFQQILSSFIYTFLAKSQSAITVRVRAYFFFRRGGKGGTFPDVEVKRLSEFIFLRPYRGQSHCSLAGSRQFPTYWGTINHSTSTRYSTRWMWYDRYPSHCEVDNSVNVFTCGSGKMTGKLGSWFLL